MSDREIIEGLMLKLADEHVNVMALSRRIGLENFKKWEKAYHEAFKYVKQ
jgi:hypothetical protein